MDDQTPTEPPSIASMLAESARMADVLSGADTLSTAGASIAKYATDIPGATVPASRAAELAEQIAADHSASIASLTSLSASREFVEAAQKAAGVDKLASGMSSVKVRDLMPRREFPQLDLARESLARIPDTYHSPVLSDGPPVQHKQLEETRALREDIGALVAATQALLKHGEDTARSANRWNVSQFALGAVSAWLVALTLYATIVLAR